MTYYTVYSTASEAEIRAELGIPDGTPLPSPLPAGANIAKNRIVWFEIADDVADRLETPIMNWVSRASSKFSNEESGQVMGGRYKYEVSLGEKAHRKLLSETLYVVNFSVLAQETYDVAINDPLDSDYNCTAVLPRPLLS